MTPSRLVTLALACVLSAAPASAHQYWLAPDRYAPAAGQPVQVGALAGTGFRGEPKPWSPDRVVRFVARTGRELDLRTFPGPGDLAWARFAPSDGGGALLGFESNFIGITLPAVEFDGYLAEEGLAGPLAARRGLPQPREGRERYRRCAKTWLAGNAADRATRPFGLPLEVVPLTIPGDTPSLRVRVLYLGQPLAGALVKTWRRPLAAGGLTVPVIERDSLGMAAEIHTDARGEAALRVTAAGEWLVSTVHMVKSADPAAAEWESTWASLTFARPGGSPRSRPAKQARRAAHRRDRHA